VSVFEQVALAWQCAVVAARQSVRPAMWIPWLPVLLLNAAALTALIGFAHPAFSWLMLPWIRAVAGPSALHYPDCFRALPLLQARAAFAIDAIAGVLASGAATWMFAERFAGRVASPGDAMRRGLGRFPTFFTVSLPWAVLTLALTVGLDVWLGSRGSSGLTVKVFQTAAVALLVGAQSVSLWLPPIVMLEQAGIADTYRLLPRRLTQGSAGSLALTLAALLVHVPVQELLRRVDAIVDRGRPEIVAALVIAESILSLLTSFVIAGAMTLTHRAIVEEER